MAQDEFQFEAEVGKVLDIVIHSLYSNKETFLRELVSNAADACDKLRYLALTEPGLMEAGSDFKIQLSTIKRDRSITVVDNGIGMSRDELIENLGTIARSGTTAFLENLSGDEKKDSALIGQFGVGFYASFSVAKKVEVLSRKAGEDKAWLWTSEGAGSFTLAEAERDFIAPFTTVTGGNFAAFAFTFAFSMGCTFAGVGLPVILKLRLKDVFCTTNLRYSAPLFASSEFLSSFTEGEGIIWSAISAMPSLVPASRRSSRVTARCSSPSKERCFSATT